MTLSQQLLDLSQNHSVSEDNVHYVRVDEIPEPVRTEFRAWLRLAQCPVIDGEGPCAYAHDFELFRQRREKLRT
ncbi:hypothetical protein [Paraburkholderia sp. RL17-337-BIB-A]|uniref:hypothetical protein n=1 Tax=Paraburkholderia sp. RL17-337-BIB-A TaxID=3031636 RepID=UPI0038B7E239